MTRRNGNKNRLGNQQEGRKNETRAKWPRKSWAPYQSTLISRFCQNRKRRGKLCSANSGNKSFRGERSVDPNGSEDAAISQKKSVFPSARKKKRALLGEEKRRNMRRKSPWLTISNGSEDGPKRSGKKGSKVHRGNARKEERGITSSIPNPSVRKGKERT